MNFSTHKAKLLERVDTALLQNKPQLVADFKQILRIASSLLPEQDFSFWLRQLDETELVEIPTTKYGVAEARRSFKLSRNLSRTGLAQLLSCLCEQLFSYRKLDDSCENQTDYHYYFHLPTRTLFKESELGDVVPNVEAGDPTETRIAWVSEINPGSGELSS